MGRIHARPTGIFSYNELYPIPTLPSTTFSVIDLIHTVSDRKYLLGRNHKSMNTVLA